MCLYLCDLFCCVNNFLFSTKLKYVLVLKIEVPHKNFEGLEKIVLKLQVVKIDNLIKSEFI